jgi:hypothetical protein
MANPLGNPEDQDVITVTSAVQTITIGYGLSSLEIQNSGSNDIYYGKADTLTSARGGVIYSNGDRKSWENLPTGWKISIRCATGKTSTLRVIYYV